MEKEFYCADQIYDGSKCEKQCGMCHPKKKDLEKAIQVYISYDMKCLSDKWRDPNSPEENYKTKKDAEEITKIALKTLFE